MAVAVVVPWRGGCPHREAALSWVNSCIPWPVTICQPTGPAWSKGQAIANGVAATDADVLVISDADVWCSDTPAAVTAVEAGHPWAVPHISIRRLTEQATADVLAGTDPESLDPEHSLEEVPYRAHLGGGVVVMRREVWEQVPMDPRFIGWGHEDDAFGVALKTVVGHPHHGRGRLWHLWHPPQPRRNRKQGSEANEALFHRYMAANHQPGRIRALVAEGRP